MTFSQSFPRLFSPTFGGAGAAVSYLLRDEFTTPESAPLTSPRTCDPGPGTLTVGNPGNLSISGGKLIWAAVAVSSITEQTARLATVGLCNLLSITAIDASGSALQSYGGSGGDAFSFFNLATRYDRIISNSSVINGLAASLPSRTYIIVRTCGYWYVADNVLSYVSYRPTLTTVGANLAASYISNARPQIDYMRVVQLPSPWNDDYGIVTQRIASAGVGATITSEANAIIEATWQAATGETYELSTRRTDDDNRWIVRCDQTGSTIKLIERNAGVETERSSAAQTWANGTSYRITIIQQGNTIKSLVADAEKNTYTSATFNNTATGIKTSHAVTNLIAWPRVLSGAALSALEAI